VLSQAEWVHKFDALRRKDNPQRVTVTPVLSPTIAAGLRRSVLQADDDSRQRTPTSRSLIECGQ
jgi:hypothetical protein